MSISGKLPGFWLLDGLRFTFYSGSEEFLQVFSTESGSQLAAKFDLSLPWGFLIHGWTDSIFADPKWTINGKGLYSLI